MTMRDDEAEELAKKLLYDGCWTVLSIVLMICVTLGWCVWMIWGRD